MHQKKTKKFTYNSQINMHQKKTKKFTYDSRNFKFYNYI